MSVSKEYKQLFKSDACAHKAAAILLDARDRAADIAVSRCIQEVSRRLGLEEQLLVAEVESLKGAVDEADDQLIKEARYQHMRRSTLEDLAKKSREAAHDLEAAQTKLTVWLREHGHMIAADNVEGS